MNKFIIGGLDVGKRLDNFLFENNSDYTRKKNKKI